MAAPISVECINRGDELPLPQLPSESQEDYLSRKALKVRKECQYACRWYSD